MLTPKTYDVASPNGTSGKDNKRPFFKLLKSIERPRVMTTEKAKAQGVFMPNWWLGILLIPALYGVFSFGQSITRIETKIDAYESRLKNVETQGRLNDEHTRILEVSIAEVKGSINTLAALPPKKGRVN